MKGLSIKKVAAIAAGAALVGTAFAPIVSALDLQKSDLFNANGTPNVKVVVGSSSAPSDGVWAGNIAAAIAEQARTYKQVSVSGSAGSGGSNASVSDLGVKLVVGGTTTYANAKTYKTGQTTGASDLNFTTSQKEISKVTLTGGSGSSLTNLKNEQRKYKWNGNNYTVTMKEELGLSTDVEMDADAGGSVADLELYISATDLNYTLNLGSGIPVYESTTSTTKFTDGTNDNIKIPFFGQDYLVREVDKSNNFIRLLKEQGKKTYVEGDLINELKGKNTLAGEDVQIKVDTVTASGPAAGSYSAKFILIGPDGEEVDVYTAAAGESLNEQFVGTDGQEVLDTLVYVDSIAVGASTGVGEVVVTVGTTLVDLYHTKGYPYDASQTSANYDYKVQLKYSSDGNYVTAIGIENDKQEWKNSGTNNPLYAPTTQALTSTGQAGEHEAFFLGNQADGVLGKNFFSVSFDGFESDEPTTTVKLTTSGDVPVLEYTDVGDRKHTIPFLITLRKSKSSDSFSFDGRTIYYASQYSADSNTYSADINGQKAAHGIVNGVKVYDVNVAMGTVTTAVFMDGAGPIVDNYGLGATVDVNGFYAKVGAFLDINGVKLQFDGNIAFAMSSFSTSSAASSTSDYLESWTDDDGNTRRYLLYADANTADRVAYRGNTVSLKGLDDVLFEYAMYADDATQGADGDIYLLLDTSTTFNGKYDGDLKFWGTDLQEAGHFDKPRTGHVTVGTASGAGRQYYWPDRSNDFGAGVSDVYYMALLGIETGGDTTNGADTTADWDTNIYINTATGKPPIGTSQKTGLSNYSVDVNINGPTGVGKVDPASLSMSLDERSDTSAYPSAAYNEQGTKFVLSNGEVTVTIPDSVRRGVIVVKSEGTTTATTGGETLTIAEGESGTTGTGTEITVEEVTYSASCSAGTGEEGTCTATPQNYFEPAAVPEQVVVLDADDPSGTLVLVGGHLVNRLSAQIADIRDRLTASGDGRDPWRDTESGNFVVAGYTAQDTVASARAFIAAVEAIDMS